MGKISDQNEIFEKLYIKGVCFGMFSSLGPEAIFFYPLPHDFEEKSYTTAFYSPKFSERDYMQVAVKSISLFMSDYSFENTKNPKGKDFCMFGVLPYPDIGMIGFTLFGYHYLEQNEEWVPISITLMVDDNHRNFIYNSQYRLKKMMLEMKEKLTEILTTNKISSQREAESQWPNMFPHFLEYFKSIENIQMRPISPITTTRRIRILFTGLENTGKSSFLLTMKREFSSLPSLLPTTEAIKNKLDFLGTTIIKWDIPGNSDLRAQVIKESHIYLYETDLIYFFVDAQNPRFDESKEYLLKLLQVIKGYEQSIPIVFILTKVDEDIATTIEMKDKVSNIQNYFLEILENHPNQFFTTSIFSIYSILNAFSYGIRLLSPNREMLEHILFEFIARLDLVSALLLNENGIVLASTEILPLDHSSHLKPSQIFEVAAPQFTAIAKQFNRQTDKASPDFNKYEFSVNDKVFLKKFYIGDFLLFGLFYARKSRNENIDDLIKTEFPELLKRIENLLHHYIQ